MANYFLIQEALGLSVGEVFLPTTDPTIYQAISDEDLKQVKSTMDALPDFFLSVPDFTWEDKAAGFKADQVDAVVWAAAINDYFSTYQDELDLWKVLDEDGTDWVIIKLTGNITGENPTNIAKSGFEDSRFQVFTPEDEGSGSSSASGS